jgi:sugar/nucleoside kinase (ribokinase family)
MSAAATKTVNPVIELHYEREGQVRIVPPDRSVQLFTVKVAIDACRAHNKQLEFNTQFQDLQERLAKWLSLHQTSVSRAFITVRDAGLLFVVVLNGTAFDPELEEAITELDIEIANAEEFELIRLSVLAIPQTSDACMHSFIAVGNTMPFGSDSPGKQDA